MVLGTTEEQVCQAPLEVLAIHAVGQTPVCLVDVRSRYSGAPKRDCTETMSPLTKLSNFLAIRAVDNPVPSEDHPTSPRIWPLFGLVFDSNI